jgi:hypothetical protein
MGTIGNSGDYELDFLLKHLPIDTILDIFYHSSIGFLGIPITDRDGKCLLKVEDMKIDLGKYKDNWKGGLFTKRSKVLRLMPYNFYYKICKDIKIKFKNVKKVSIEAWEIPLGREYKKHYYRDLSVVDDSVVIKIDFHETKDLMNLVISLNVTETIDDNFLAEIVDVKELK